MTEVAEGQWRRIVSAAATPQLCLSGAARGEVETEEESTVSLEDR